VQAREMTAPRANIYAVAERAGVSIATVSRVQRGIGPVSTEMRERVEQAIEELGYSPSPTGRALAGQRLDAIGIVFPDLAGPYYSAVLLGAEAASVAAGSSLLILATHGRPQAEALARDLSAKVDGLIVMGRTVSDEAVRALAARVPLVLLAREPVGELPTVRSANREPARRLVAHLIEVHGHTRLSFVGDPGASPDAEDRWQGFLDAHRALGVPAPPAAFAAPFDEHGGRAAAGTALDREPSPTALVCASDEVAIGAYAAVHERGLRPGRDIAVTGWDDIQLARFVTPPLTTVRQPMDQLGRIAAELLAQRVAGEPAESRTLPSDLVVRASCGCTPPTDREVVQ
jgi:LacI family transcriptional regulator